MHLKYESALGHPSLYHWDQSKVIQSSAEATVLHWEETRHTIRSRRHSLRRPRHSETLGKGQHHPRHVIYPVYLHGYPILGYFISQKYDFGTAYAYLRPF